VVEVVVYVVEEIEPCPVAIEEDALRDPGQNESFRARNHAEAAIAEAFGPLPMAGPAGPSAVVKEGDLLSASVKEGDLLGFGA
jgi:hypothetical protein